MTVGLGTQHGSDDKFDKKPLPPLETSVEPQGQSLAGLMEEVLSLMWKFLFIDTHVEQLASDKVGRVVKDYGQLGTKIQSLSQLKVLPRGRAELARLSLGRVYVRRCVSKRGQWTSGLHLFWWTTRTLSKRPSLSVGDFRTQLDMDLKRQHELAQWSIVMLRLTFLADIGGHVAQGLPIASSPTIRSVGERLAALISLVDDAAEEASTDLDALMNWIEKVAQRRIRRVMSEAEYQDISQDLHQD